MANPVPRTVRTAEPADPADDEIMELESLASGQGNCGLRRSLDASFGTSHQTAVIAPVPGAAAGSNLQRTAIINLESSVPYPVDAASGVCSCGNAAVACPVRNPEGAAHAKTLREAA
jgi:hypothetical protein